MKSIHFQTVMQGYAAKIQVPLMLAVSAIAGGVCSVSIYKAVNEDPALSSQQKPTPAAAVAKVSPADILEGKLVVYPQEIRALFEENGNGLLVDRELRKLLGERPLEDKTVVFNVFQYEFADETRAAYRASVRKGDHWSSLPGSAEARYNRVVIPITLGDLRMKYSAEKEPLMEAIHHAVGALESPRKTSKFGNPTHWKALSAQSLRDPGATVPTPPADYSGPEYEKTLMSLMPRMSPEDQQELVEASKGPGRR